jgi:hypothetical protein
MKGLLLVTMAAGFILAAFCVPVSADIPGPWDYQAVYEMVNGTPAWSYASGSVEYGLPTFGTNGATNWWHVPNFRDDGKMKIVYFEIVDTTVVSPPVLVLNPQAGLVTSEYPVYDAGTKSWMCKWLVTIQPGWEEIQWGAGDTLHDRVFRSLYQTGKLRVATYCYVPEPSSLLVLIGGLGCLAPLIRRRR